MCGAPNYIHIGDRLAGAHPAVTGISQAEKQAEDDYNDEEEEFKINCRNFKDEDTIEDRCVIRIKKVIEVTIEWWNIFGNNDTGFA